MDEVCDATGRPVFSVIVVKIDVTKFNKPVVIHLENLEKVNNSTVSIAFNYAMMQFRPNGIKYGNVLLLLTDAAP